MSTTKPKSRNLTLSQPCLSPTEVEAIVARQMSEAELQKNVEELAILMGYTVRHVRDARRQNLEGLPDLLLLKKPRKLWIELKAERGQLRPSQVHLFCLLIDCGDEVYVVRPRDWLSGRVQELLSGC